MSRIRCSDDDASHVPCRCDPITGCGHLSSWHIVTERWVARCLVPDCECKSMDACDCVAGLTGDVDSDESIAKEIGITAWT